MVRMFRVWIRDTPETILLIGVVSSLPGTFLTVLVPTAVPSSTSSV